MTVIVSNSSTLPSFTTCENNRNVTIKSRNNVVSFDWGGEVTSSNSDGCTYASDGTYTIVASNSDGCTASKEVAIGNATLHPCTVANPHTDYSGGGYNNADDGKETVVDGKVTTVTDYDGNIYPVVQIGSQCWLAENMRCTHSPSTGSYIVNPQNKIDSDASMSFDAKVAHWSPNNNSTNSRYGLLYNWCAAVDTFYANVVTDHKSYGGTYYYTVQEVYYETRAIGGFSCEITGNRRGICPKGWHIPSDQEWTTMLGSVNNAGELSGGCDDYWGAGSTTNGKPNSYVDPSRNSKGFGALPAGQFNNIMQGSGSSAYFWSSTVSDNGSTGTAAENNKAQFAWTRYLSSNSESISRTYTSRSIGHSVRCVRD